MNSPVINPADTVSTTDGVALVVCVTLEKSESSIVNLLVYMAGDVSHMLSPVFRKTLLINGMLIQHMR